MCVIGATERLNGKLLIKSENLFTPEPYIYVPLDEFEITCARPLWLQRMLCSAQRRR